MATQEVAFNDVASLRNWADCAARLFDFEYSSEILQKEIKALLCACVSGSLSV